MLFVDKIKSLKEEKQLLQRQLATILEGGKSAFLKKKEIWF